MLTASIAKLEKPYEDVEVMITDALNALKAYTEN